MMFRINFLTVWLIINIIYSVGIGNYVANQNMLVVNDGSWGFLEIFAAYLAILVLYRVFFGGLHILKFKLMRISKKYRTQKYDMKAEFKKLRKAENCNESELVLNNDFKLLENADNYDEDQALIEESLANNGERPRRVKGYIN